MNENYVAYLKSQKKSERTIEIYTGNVKKMLGLIGKNDVDVTAIDLVNWQSSISHLASATVNQMVASVKSYYRFMKLFKMVDNDPAENLIPPAVKSKQKEYVDADMIKAMLDNTRTIRDKAVILTFVTTGIRQAELSAITREQYKKMKSEGKNTIVSIGKGNKENLVAFNQQTIEAIDKYLLTRHDDCEWLFAGYTGGQLRDNNINNMIKSTAKRAGIPFADSMSAHWLRAACASIMSERGVPLATIRDTLHHSNLSTTSRYIKTNMKQFNDANACMTF